MKKKTEQNAAGAPQTGKTAGAGAAGFLKKNWKWLVPVACVAVLGGVWLLKPKADKPASVDTSYVETAPEQRDLVNALSGTGTLKPANTYNVKSLVSGKVLTCSFEEGDNVEEGDVLYTVDSSDATTKVEQAGITLQQAQRNYDKTVDRQYVRAEVAGVVSSLKVAKGDEVTSGQEVAVIRDNSKMTLALEFPAADAAGFSVGQSADVTLDGTFETLTGTITAVTGTDALSTGNLLTRTVTISVRNAGGLTTAQAATATVNGVSSIGAATFQYQAERTLTALAAGTVIDATGDGLVCRRAGVPMQVLLKKPYFYLTMIGMMLATIASNGVYSAVVPHLQDRGLSAAYAAKMLSLMLVLLAVDKIVLGMLADRFGAHFSTLLCVLFTFSGIVVLTLVKNEWQAVIAVVLLSVSVCLNGFIQPLLAAEIFGRSAYNTTLGIMMAMLSVGGLLSSPLVNFSFDATGSYTRILIVLAVIAAVDALFLLPAFHAEAKYRRELEVSGQLGDAGPET